jgi:hypothetical protein
MPDSTTLNPTQVAVKIANVVFIFGALCSILISTYAAYRIFAPVSADYLDVAEDSWVRVRTFYAISFAGGAISAALFGAGLRLKDHLRVNLSLLFISTGLTVYAVETYLEQANDKRTKLEVLSDLREIGIEAYPRIPPVVLLTAPSTKNGLRTTTGKIFPLSGISNKMMVGDKETYYWMTYISDRYGFHNPDDVYNVDTVDIVLTGDSYAEGCCVRSNETISAVLRTFDFDVINLGQSGNGPILEYSTLKEYGKHFKPKIVLWLYYVNDIFHELPLELNSNMLTRYLYEDQFSQDLISRQNEINSVLIKYVNEKMSQQTRQQSVEKTLKRKLLERIQLIKNDLLNPAHRDEFLSEPLIKILKLRNLRKAVGLIPRPIIEKETNFRSIPVTSLKSTFMMTLEKTEQLVSSWNGRLYFVYLPAGKNILDKKEDPWRKVALNTANELGIPIIDIRDEIFFRHRDFLSLFPFRNPDHHYNATGYRLVAEAIAERLKADGVLQ